MRKIILILVALGILATVSAGILRKDSPSSSELILQKLQDQSAQEEVPSVNHSLLSPLQTEFSSPQQVTAACLSCHTERGKEVMASSHWSWERMEHVPGRGIRSLGKKNLLNNFCIGVSENLEGCDKCHAGYNYTNHQFNFSNPANIDCLICHDTTQTYAKSGLGLPQPSVNLTKVAQSVGTPKRANCGTCHFFGGGGNNVKHGDLEEALFAPDRQIDVHMATNGVDLECVACHTAQNHRMKGKLYSVSSMNRDRSSCEQCHTQLPHKKTIINEHTLKVACQTCHIPTYAKAAATKMTWDWSTAGQLKDGQPYTDKDEQGNVIYTSAKGSFGWGQKLKPDYIFFNGTATHYLLGDEVIPDAPIPINQLLGNYDDPQAKIIPVKIHRAKQIYDPNTKLLVQPKLVAKMPGQGGFWKDFDWHESAKAGMASVDLPYSGEYTFVDTEMTWPINHMVAPKEDSVQCIECHTRNGSRLAALKGFYMPGRDANPVVEWLGHGLIILVIVGVLVHATARMIVHKRYKKETQ